MRLTATFLLSIYLSLGVVHSLYMQLFKHG